MEQFWGVRRERGERGDAIRIDGGHQDVTGCEDFIQAFDRLLHMPEGSYRLNTTHRAAPLQQRDRIRIEFVMSWRSPQSLLVSLDHKGELSGIERPHIPIELCHIEDQLIRRNARLTVSEPCNDVSQRGGHVRVEVVTIWRSLHESQARYC